MIICDNYNIDDYYDDKDVNDDENYGTLFLQFPRVLTKYDLIHSLYKFNRGTKLRPPILFFAF